MTPRPFRFALTLGDAADRGQLVEIVRRAETSGFAVLAGVDHIGPPLGVLPLLAAVAQFTSLRVSPMVVANDYRHPVQLAKDAATIDRLSEGRFELGIGTGWIKQQYESAGIAYDPPGVRVARLSEAIAVIKGCWTGERFNFAGDHYEVDIDGLPLPTQQPRPPILIAASGPRMLRLAGRQADIVSITITRGLTGFDGFATAVARSGAHIDGQLAAIRDSAGDRYPDIELNVMIHHHVADTAAVAELAQRAGTSLRAVEQSPHLLVGSVGQMAEALEAKREQLGISYIVIRGTHLDVMAPLVERLAGT